MDFKVGDIVYIKGFNECGAIKVVHENFIDKIVRYEVKTNNNEYTLLGRMLEPIDINLQHTQNLEQRIEKLEKEVFKPLTIKDSIQKSLEENLKISLKPSLLTEDERVILKNLDKRYKWIIRDSDNNLYICINEPFKKENMFWNCKGGFDNLGLFNHLFDFIKWEYKEQKPYNIEELLKEECNE